MQHDLYHTLQTGAIDHGGGRDQSRVRREAVLPMHILCALTAPKGGQNRPQ